MHEWQGRSIRFHVDLGNQKGRWAPSKPSMLSFWVALGNQDLGRSSSDVHCPDQSTGNQIAKPSVSISEGEPRIRFARRELVFLHGFGVKPLDFMDGTANGHRGCEGQYVA